MAVSEIKRGTEMATIDCSMIVVTTEEETPRSLAVTSATKLAIEPQIEVTEAVKLTIKGKLKAQRPQTQTITGHILTLSDNLTILELIEILQGDTLEKDEDGKITSYTPPAVGTDYKPVKFKMDCYSAQLDEGGNTVAYEKVSYPGCTGQPVALNSEDNVFRIAEYTINSMPSKGEPAYAISFVDALPAVSA